MNLLVFLSERGLQVSRTGHDLVVKPADKLTEELRSLILEHKPELLAQLPDTRGSDTDELRRLVYKVGVFYAYTDAEHVSALEVALSDPLAALASYRQVAKERGL